MLETLMRLYVMSMTHDIRSPLPHLVGPPGCGKSTYAQQLAQLLGVNLHVINVSRISPLELEGVQMPMGTNESMVLRLLHATFWTQLKPGDIVLFDEFLRGFPEVYNGLLDILTSRQVEQFQLPKVFMMAASNSFTTYDGALEDRLLHIKVTDLRTDKKALKSTMELVAQEIGLLPEVATSDEMADLFRAHVIPMYDMLDFDKAGTNVSVSTDKGTSVRKIIGQALMRHVQLPELQALIEWNNTRAMATKKHQFLVLLAGKPAKLDQYRFAVDASMKVLDKMAPKQRLNTQLNHQILEMTEARHHQGDDS